MPLKNLSTQHRLNLQEWHEFDTLRTSATASQQGTAR